MVIEQPTITLNSIWLYCLTRHLDNDTKKNPNN